MELYSLEYDFVAALEGMELRKLFAQRLNVHQKKEKEGEISEPTPSMHSENSDSNDANELCKSTANARNSFR